MLGPFLKISTVWTGTKGKKKANVVYRCCWLQFSVNQSHCILVSCSSSNPTANSLDSDSVSRELFAIRILDTQTDLFFGFMGFNGNLSCQSAAAASRLPNILQSPHLRDDFPFTQLSLQLALAHTSHRDLKTVLFHSRYISPDLHCRHLSFSLWSVNVFCAEGSRLIGFGWKLLDCRFWPLLWTKVLLIHQRRFRNGNLQGFVLASKF